VVVSGMRNEWVVGGHRVIVRGRRSLAEGPDHKMKMCCGNSVMLDRKTADARALAHAVLQMQGQDLQEMRAVAQTTSGRTECGSSTHGRWV
jgi:hypothetical protein